MADELLNAQDLITAKKHDTFHSEVVTGKAGGLSTGANIDYATNAVTGQVQKTLPATVNGIDWSYVGKFADGVTFTKKSDFAIDANGTQWIYTGSLPFSATAGTVPSEPTYQAVHVKSASLVTNSKGGSVQDFIDTQTFDNVDAMLAFNGLVAGQRCCTGGTTWEYLGGGNSLTVNFRELTAVYFDDFGADSTGATITHTAMQSAIDYLRRKPPLAGANYEISYGSRGKLAMRPAGKYRIASPLIFEEDVIQQLYASGISVEPNGAQIIVDASFVGATRVKTSLGATTIINSAVIVGVRDYATQSGHYVSFVEWDKQKVDGGGVVTSALYNDVISHCSFDKWTTNNCDYGLGGKVSFLSSYAGWKLYNCNGTISFSNTSLADGYNSGNGLEGGGLTFGDWTISGDNGAAQPRLYFNKIGEFKFTSFTSYQGLGDGIVIERDPLASTTGSKWNQLGRVELGDLDGSPLKLTNCSFIQLSDLIMVKNGLSVPIDTSLITIDGCTDITIRGLDVDQFYDFSATDPLSWGPVLDCVNSNRVTLVVNNARSIPATHNLYSMFRFRGTSEHCSVELGNLNQASFARLYKNPVSSEVTCNNIKVRGGATRTGAFVSAIPVLLGAGDSWDDLSNEFGKSPVSGKKSRVALTSGRDSVQNFELASIRKSISNNVLTDIATINFNGVSLHNAIIEIDFVVSGDSGYASKTEKRKFLFNRTPASTGVTLNTLISSETLTFSGSANYTVQSIVTSDATSQYQIRLQTTVIFGGGIGDTAGVISGTIKVSSKGDFEIVKN